MAILVSPSNNTGWGIGVSKMHGGARHYSAVTPVEVRRYYRSPWGSRRRRGLPVYGPPTREVSEALAEIELSAERNLRRRASRLRRRARNAAAAATAVAEAEAATAPVVVVRRRRGRPRRRMRRTLPVYHPSIVEAAAAAIPVPVRRTRRNVYFVRNSQGVRVPVLRRPVVRPVV